MTGTDTWTQRAKTTAGVAPKCRTETVPMSASGVPHMDLKIACMGRRRIFLPLHTPSRFGTTPQEEQMSHPNCHGPAGHVCQTPSGRACIDCGKPAGTLWGPYWCPDCDVKRLDGISASLKSIAADLT